MNRFFYILFFILGYSALQGAGYADELLMGQVMSVDRENSAITVMPITGDNRGESGKNEAVVINMVDGYLPSTIKKGGTVRVWVTPASSDNANASPANVSGRIGRGRYGRCDCTGIRSRLKKSVSGRGQGHGFRRGAGRGR
jgi:hypothetical protein